jgi:hypothetical protein
MRVLLAGIVAVSLGLVLTSPLRAAESQAAFSKRVGKYATLDPSNPKSVRGLCWCKDGIGSSGMGEAGYVVQEVTAGQVFVGCSIPEYNSGVVVSFIPCVVEWDMLAK